jgi:phosphonopyruvate decarboxylase
MMKRDECLKALAEYRTDEIVVAVYKAAQEWIQIAPSPLNYTFHGAMGQGSSHALGVALGRPDRRVILLDGDGSLLMNLGSLVTIANEAPKNLVHCLCENGTYETNGSIPIPGAGKFRFAEIAKAAGYPKTYEFDDIAEWERAVGDIIHEDGPIFVTLKVEPGAMIFPDNFRLLRSVESREAFRQALSS